MKYHHNPESRNKIIVNIKLKKTLIFSFKPANNNKPTEIKPIQRKKPPIAIKNCKSKCKSGLRQEFK